VLEEKKNIYGHAPKSLNFKDNGQLTILETEEIIKVRNEDEHMAPTKN